MKKKIIISVTNDIAFDQRMQKTAESLHRFGNEVCIVGRLKNTSSNFKSDYFQIHRFRMMFQSGKLFYLEYNFRLFLYLLTSEFDILVGVDLDSIFPNILVGRWKNKPVIYDAHEYFTEVPEVTQRKLVKSIWKWVERYSIPKCSQIYTVSSGIAIMFENEYHKPCQLIYNFPKTDQQIQRTESSERIIIYQGDLNEGRGLDIAIPAMNDIEAELWIIGDGYERKKLENLALMNGVQNKVKFLGYISPSELKKYTSQAYLGLNLLENKGLNHYYSLANKFFDYIQQGVPPISMNFPEYKYFNDIYHCSILLDEFSVESFASAIKTLLIDQKKYSELSKNCDIAHRFLNWEVQEETLLSIYQNV